VIWEQKDMDIRQKLQARLEARFALSHALQKSLEILRLPQAELALLIQGEIEKNPLLELDSFSFNPLGNSTPETAAIPSLRDHLLAQIREAFDHPQMQKIAEEMIGYLDEKGFFTEPLEKLTLLFNLPIRRLEMILSTLQTFDPPGIFSRNLQEAFLIQLKLTGQKNTLSYRLVEQSFDDLTHGRYSTMKQKLYASATELRVAIQKLARLSTRPASKFQVHHTHPIHPDLQIFCIDHQWFVKPMEELLPKFHVKKEYLQMPELRFFAASAKWLLRSVNRRRKMLLSLGTYIVRKQPSFLSGEGPRLPLPSSELALVFGVHESTISRAISDKYIASPCGLLPLRALITPAHDPAKDLLQKLISSENKQFPFTDDQIAQALKKAGCDIARRTVAKYRKQLDIASAAIRKHWS
jgi:RNA polymerase sigma-54 factor